MEGPVEQEPDAVGAATAASGGEDEQAKKYFPVLAVGIAHKLRLLESLPAAAASRVEIDEIKSDVLEAVMVATAIKLGLASRE